MCRPWSTVMHCWMRRSTTLWFCSLRWIRYSVGYSDRNRMPIARLYRMLSRLIDELPHREKAPLLLRRDEAGYGTFHRLGLELQESGSRVCTWSRMYWQGTGNGEVPGSHRGLTETERKERKMRPNGRWVVFWCWTGFKLKRNERHV